MLGLHLIAQERRFQSVDWDAFSRMNDAIAWDPCEVEDFLAWANGREYVGKQGLEEFERDFPQTVEMLTP
jgi:hypothetical protein